MYKFLTDIEDHKEEIFSTYHSLHAIPEKGWEEYKTSAYIKEALEKAGYEVIADVGGTTGVIGILKGSF